MLGGASPLSRCAWSRRTSEAPGRHREVGSEGSVERMCGATDRNPIGGVAQSGRAGTPQQSPPSTSGCALYIGRLCTDGMTAYRGRSVGCPGTGLRGEQSALTAPQKSADGIVGARERAEGLNGGRESLPAVERRDGIRRGVERGSTSGMNSQLARRAMTLRLGCVYHPDLLYRTAGDVTRLSGGVGGGRP